MEAAVLVHRRPDLLGRETAVPAGQPARLQPAVHRRAAELGDHDVGGLLDDQLGAALAEDQRARSGSPSSRSGGRRPPPGRAAPPRGAPARGRSGSSRACSSPTSALAIAARIAAEGLVWVSERRSIISPQSNEPLTSRLDDHADDTARPTVHPARDRAEGRAARLHPDTGVARLALLGVQLEPHDEAADGARPRQALQAVEHEPHGRDHGPVLQRPARELRRRQREELPGGRQQGLELG